MKNSLELNQNISENIKLCRIQRGHSIAHMSLETDINPKTYDKYEKAYPIPLERLIKICKYLDFKLDDVINKKASIEVSFY